MRRRGFIAGLLALPFVRPIARVAAAVKARLFPVVYVGAGLTGDDCAPTLQAALNRVAAGGTVFLMAGHTETITEPLELGPGMSIIGEPGPNRPILSVAHTPRDMTCCADDDEDGREELT